MVPLISTIVLMNNKFVSQLRYQRIYTANRAMNANPPSLHFQHWFPQYGPTFQGYINGACEKAFIAYINPNAPTTCNYGGCLSGRVVHCLLAQATESMKANMAAAAVLLGLLPTTLSLIGSNTVETGVLALRRPFLATLLAAGTPAVVPMRMFDYDDPVKLMNKSPPLSQSVSLPGWFTAKTRSSTLSTRLAVGLVVTAEYLVATAISRIWVICWMSRPSVASRPIQRPTQPYGRPLR